MKTKKTHSSTSVEGRTDLIIELIFCMIKLNLHIETSRYMLIFNNILVLALCLVWVMCVHEFDEERF